VSLEKQRLRVRAGGRAFLLELDQVAFVTRIRSDIRTLRLPRRDVSLTSLAWLLGLAPGSPSEAVVVAMGEDYRALAVDDAELVDDAGDEEALDIEALFLLRSLNPEASGPPR
jgi:hypothetical protein